MAAGRQAGRTSDLFAEKPDWPDAGGFRIGTSGFSFPDWAGAFYPEKLPRSRWLEYYARCFSVVEINATYYRIPSAAAFAGMAERTPHGFEFWVKLPGDATHGTDDPNPALNAFSLAVKPLADAEKLTGFLAQFPPSFAPHAKSTERLRRLAEFAQGMPLVVEFRRRDWLTESNFQLMEQLKLVIAAVDLPPLPELPGAEIYPDSRLNYVRFHGRNAGTWHDQTQGDRYDWDYTEAELKEWLPNLKRLMASAATNYLFFNNCHSGQAVKNARMMRELIQSLMLDAG